MLKSVESISSHRILPLYLFPSAVVTVVTIDAQTRKSRWANQRERQTALSRDRQSAGRMKAIHPALNHAARRKAALSIPPPGIESSRFRGRPCVQPTPRKLPPSPWGLVCLCTAAECTVHSAVGASRNTSYTTRLHTHKKHR